MPPAATAARQAAQGPADALGGRWRAGGSDAVMCLLQLSLFMAVHNLLCKKLLFLAYLPLLWPAALPKCLCEWQLPEGRCTLMVRDCSGAPSRLFGMVCMR